jgi:hypothetical protein
MAEAEYFDTARWQEIIQQPDWYIQLYPELQALHQQWAPDSQEAHDSKQAVRHFFESALLSGEIALGESGQDLDAQRQPIDTVVIHHTSSKPGYTLPYMNAVQMLNVYVPYFNDPTQSGEELLKGQPLWSNHIRDGRPVFYLYHWLIRMDGTAERLLKDRELGWHAANWEINCRSVGICLDNDYENQDPTPEVVQGLATFIQQHYPHIAPERIFGHGEVSLKAMPTICPGTNFTHGWKLDLLALLTS